MGYDGFNHYSSAPAFSWSKRGQQNQALGRSCGGFSTKIHAVCDALGNPIRFTITAGQVSDYREALTLIDGFKTKSVLADKGYDADYIVEGALKCGAEAVIPPKSSRNNPREYDKELYKERNLIERLFNKLKHFRRVATRYDKTASAFLAFVHIAAICLWLK
jgi:transposase